MKRILTVLSLALIAGASLPAWAQSSPWQVRVGPAHVQFHESSVVKVAGAEFPGAAIEVKSNTALASEIGYAVSDDWMLRLAFGVPPTTTLSAAGSLKSMMPPLTGKLGRAKYDPAVLSLTYGLPGMGAFKPYIGAGVNYTKVFSTEDGDVGGLKIDSGWGSALQLGFDVALNKQWNLFVDVRKIYFKTDARGTVPALGNPPADVSIKLDPTLIHVGFGYRF